MNKKHTIISRLVGMTLLLVGTISLQAIDNNTYIKGIIQVVFESFEFISQSMEPTVETINLTSVGDIMMHEPQIKSGYIASTDSYCYDYMFDEVRAYLEEADLAVGNLELTMSGADQGYSGYPQFNAPNEIADALKNCGFDILTTANNHSLDRRFYGVQKTIEALDDRGIAHTGTFKSKEDSEKILIQEVKHTKIAFLAYTYGTNGIPVDKGKAFSVNYIDKDKMAQDIRSAREQGAELICVSIHFGNEYMRVPNTSQKKLVDFLVNSGADIILGSHPHVLQPMEIRRVSTEGKEKEVVILFSQGNFISAQRGRYNEAGAIFNIQLVKRMDTGAISIEQLSYIPTWVDQSSMKGRLNYRVLPARKGVLLYESEGDELISASDYTKLKRTLNDIRNLFATENTKIIERETTI